MPTPSVSVLHVPSALGPERVGAWMSMWAGARSVEFLTIHLESPIAPAIGVLLAAGIESRKACGLQTRAFMRSLSGTTVQSVDLPRESRRVGLQLSQALTSIEVAEEFALERATAPSSGAQDLPWNAVQSACPVAEELGANIVHHSFRSDTGFGAVRACLDRRRIQLAFADAGIGFLASLQRNPELTGRIRDDGEAIQLALERGVSGSTNPRQNMGVGLAIVRDTADQLDADLWIASGSALFHRRTIDGVRQDSIRTIEPWPGAWICFDAPLSGSA